MNLPCMFYYFSNYESEEAVLDLQEIYSELSQDDSVEIKCIVAKGIHEILELVEKSGKNPFLFEESFSNLLNSEQNKNNKMET